MTLPLTDAEAAALVRQQMLADVVGPASVTIDGRGSVTGRSVADQIALANHLATRVTPNPRGLFGMSFRQIVPPGAG